MFITIDPFYSVQFYNECLEALKNNGIEYKEYISIKPPYNWVLEIDQYPIMLNYEELNNSHLKFLVNKITPLTDNESYLLYRRDKDKNNPNLDRFVLNDSFGACKKEEYGILFNAKGRDHLLDLSKDFPDKIWYMGKYYNNRYRVCLSDNKMIKNYIDKDDILLEYTGGDIYSFEAEFNWKVLRNNDILVKYTKTPFFKNGKYHPVKIKGDRDSKLIL